MHGEIFNIKSIGSCLELICITSKDYKYDTEIQDQSIIV